MAKTTNKIKIVSLLYIQKKKKNWLIEEGERTVRVRRESMGLFNKGEMSCRQGGDGSEEKGKMGMGNESERKGKTTKEVGVGDRSEGKEEVGVGDKHEEKGRGYRSGGDGLTGMKVARRGVGDGN
ncbi:hypothetical protein ACH5RR_028838 [Cinchona calisaya]|uniref:Uncharacterized protein n=1 Tax=Cinchona calisaya TaxID=153742 RepID=A0ABD2YT83_9GENT